MKRVTQCICLLLVLSAFMGIPAMAAEVSPRASSYFMSHSCYIEEVSSSQFKVWFLVTGVQPMDEIGAGKIYIQRSSDGVTWETVQTYSKNNYSNLICKDTTTHGSSVTYSSATAGYRYRARVDFYAKLDNGSATYIDYTSSISR